MNFSLTNLFFLAWLTDSWQGNQRLRRLYNAVENGNDSAPVDLRFIKKPMSLVGVSASSVRADVISYLTRVYESIAESIPDIRDSAFDDLAPARGGSAETLDVYAIELKRQAEENVNMVAKPRKRRKSVELNMERTHGETAKETKYLPPGFMKEYYVQYVSVSTLPQPASFPTFWRVTGPEWVIDLISFRI